VVFIIQARRLSFGTTAVTNIDSEVLRLLLKAGADLTEVLEATKNLTIKQFCKWAGISLNAYYTLEKEGRGPRVMALSRMTRRIAMSEALAWQERMSNPAGKELARQTLERERCRETSTAAGRLAAASPNFITNRRRAG
jgi:predicted DNA-binding transcriptional regulator AlpA